MNPLFTTPIRSAAEARKWYADMHAAGLLFHPDDSAATIVRSGGGRVFSNAEARHIDARTAECFEYLPNPCAVALALIMVEK